jgi:diguanylate cyclase (GGDEF)-like protein
MVASELDLVLDALAGLLRDFGRHAFDLTRQDARKTQTLFDQWAQHVVIGAEAPTRKGAVASLAQRHFADLRASFAAHRKVEQAEVNAAQDALRDVVWTFVSSINRVTQEDQADDQKVGKTLTGLVDGLEHAAPQDFRKLAIDAVRAVQGVLEARKERQQKQVAEMSQKLETLGSQLEIARRESTTDGLTHLFNRRAFDDQLPRTAELARLRGVGAALLIIDVDHFKKVNDTWGHPAGDAVLRILAHETIRVFKRKGDFVARYGGEELAVLICEVDHREVQAQADKVRETIATAAIPWEGATLHVTASVGGALWRADETNEAWLARADAALYAAKHTGRNRVSISD